MKHYLINRTLYHLLSAVPPWIPLLQARGARLHQPRNKNGWQHLVETEPAFLYWKHLGRRKNDRWDLGTDSFYTSYRLWIILLIRKYALKFEYVGHVSSFLNLNLIGLIFFRPKEKCCYEPFRWFPARVQPFSSESFTAIGLRFRPDNGTMVPHYPDGADMPKVTCEGRVNCLEKRSELRINLDC